MWLLAAGTPLVAQEARYPLVPWPARLTPDTGALQLRPGYGLRVDTRLRGVGAIARTQLAEAVGAPPSTGAAARDAGAVAIRYDRAVADSGGYRLVVGRDSAVIRARTPRGAFYGLQTLRQLIGPRSTVPRVSIEDSPRFPWRGMHLDVGRHHFPVDFIKRYIDLLARHKMNVFHWHLTEDQGWRIEIRRYPRLTGVGGCRRETMVAKNFDPYVGDGTRYCGWYTQAQVREVVRYAAERFVTVVPEIEMPGHSVAALAAYPELACTPGPFEVFTKWGVTEDIYCPSERTFAFLQDVLREVMQLFPSRFIHVGGDEAPKKAWRESHVAQEVMRREGLRTEEELQSWFIRRMERFLNASGRRVIGWDEILEGGLAPRAAVMSWRGTAGGIAAAREGHDVVMTPTSHAYFDYYQGDERFEPLAIGGFLPLERVYAFEPVPDSLTAPQARHVLGAQGNVWTEYLKTPEAVEYMALPRLLAMAEVTWSPRGARDWNAFVTRLPARLAELDAMGVNYRLPGVVGLEEDRLTLGDTVVLMLRAAIGGATVRYTTDGTDPVAASAEARGPVVVPVTEAGALVVARAFLPSGRSSPPRAARFRRTTLRPPTAVDPASLENGLQVAYVTGQFSRVAELDTAMVRRAERVASVGLPPWAPPEHYGLRFAGYVRVPADGIWRFRLTSDDGAVLRIGDAVVVDHDGLHGAEERTGQVALRAGLHPLRLDYFQRGGGRALSLTMQREDEAPASPAFWRGR